MKTLIVLLAGFTAVAQSLGRPEIINGRFESRAFSGDLSAQLKAPSASWFGYAVRTTPGDHNNCCWNNGNQCGCRLEGGSGSVMSDSRTPGGPVQLEGSTAVAVLFRVANNAIEKVQVYSLSCPLDAGGLPFIWITGVPANASLAYLEKQAALFDGAAVAIAQHDDPQADAVLSRLARPPQTEKLREKAIFWLGESRGARGVSILQEILANDSSEHIRDKAVFALSVSKQPEALNFLIQVAKNDASPHVRGQALFWLAQKAGQRAVSAITDAIENDVDTSVKKHAVFALSQLPKDEGVPRLIEVAKNQKNREVRKQALFWLGQSGDPRALAFIEQTLVR
jgi:hypothetical protein